MMTPTQQSLAENMSPEMWDALRYVNARDGPHFVRMIEGPLPVDDRLGQCILTLERYGFVETKAVGLTGMWFLLMTDAGDDALAGKLCGAFPDAVRALRA